MKKQLKNLQVQNRHILELIKGASSNDTPSWHFNYERKCADIGSPDAFPVKLGFLFYFYQHDDHRRIIKFNFLTLSFSYSSFAPGRVYLTNTPRDPFLTCLFWGKQ
ncbi:MAG: hypothetical protein QHH10_06660 [Peptococcaceae bacterium]|jgi:hypothetical protein|nr:hypothetical protein [Peptococcaceae bacterium]MDH7524980.1 hypothetical protein [Peptococcaceae bacterium]